MEPNVRPCGDPLLAEKIMVVIDQMGYCRDCRFARLRWFGLECMKHMHPYGLDDGCDHWNRRV
jgi:hypothetical protein